MKPLNEFEKNELNEEVDIRIYFGDKQDTEKSLQTSIDDLKRFIIKYSDMEFIQSNRKNVKHMLKLQDAYSEMTDALEALKKIDHT